MSRILRQVRADGGDPELEAALQAEYVAIIAEVEEAEGNYWFRAQLDGLTETQLSHLTERARASANPYLRAQFADAVLFRRRGAQEMAGIAVNTFVAHADVLLAQESAPRAIRSLARAARIATMAKDQAMAKRVAEGIRNAIQTLTTGTGVVWLSELAKPATSLSSLVGERLVQELNAGIETAFNEESSKAEPSFVRAKLLLESAIVLRRHLKEPDAGRSGFEELAELTARQAEAEADALSRSLWFAEAAALFKRAGRPGRYREMLVRVENNKSAMDASLSTSKTYMEIPTALLDRVAAPYLEAADLYEALGRMAQEDTLLPQVPDPGASAAPRSVIASLVSVVRLDAGLNMAPVTEERRAAADTAVAFQRYLAATATGRTHTLRRLRSERGLDAGAVLEFLAAWDAMPVHRMPFFRSALEAYFRDDRIGFIRGIIPEFEALLRHLADIAEIAVVKEVPSGDHEYRSGKEFIHVDPIKTALGEDVSYNVNMMLYDRDSLSIRDNDAHAIADAEFYSELLTDALFVLLLRMTRATRVDLTPLDGGGS